MDWRMDWRINWQIDKSAIIWAKKRLKKANHPELIYQIQPDKFLINNVVMFITFTFILI
jgi:hypothetical protein